MTRAPLTVVIPVYNRAEQLRECLDSIARQSLRPARVIVVDDGSTDGSADVARSHSAVDDVVVSNHGGAAAARNAGLRMVDTEWTMFFDSDDTMLPDHIAAACAGIDADTDIVGWDVCHTDGKRSAVKRFYPVDSQWNNVMHGGMATQRYMARTDLFRLAGGWDDTTQIWDDVELGSRLLNLRPRIRKIAGVRVNMLVHSDSITGTTWSGRNDRFLHALDALRRNLGADARFVDLRQAILAADIWRENPEEGRAMLDAIANAGPLTRLAFHYRRLGGRGIARILRPLFGSKGRTVNRPPEDKSSTDKSSTDKSSTDKSSPDKSSPDR